MALVTLGAAFAPEPVQAWGKVGHAVIAERAQAQLTPAARQALAPLLEALGVQSLADIASWADDRRTRQQAHWHFVNMPRGRCHYIGFLDCPRGQCLVAAVREQVALLADSSADAAHRANALIYVVHLAGGDSSQPLHAGSYDDKGGNKYQIRVGNRGTNLHAFWDTGLLMHIAHTSRNETAIERLGQALTAFDAQRRPAPALTPETWIEQSCRVWQQPGFYPPRQVPQSYIDWATPVVERQLVLGADELAGVLNQALVGRDPFRRL
ncbi:MAG: S1/P1 nuclease [Sulfuricaulis sp.]